MIIILSSSVKSDELSVPAEFVSYLTLPGTNNIILRPSDLFVDHVNGEVYVADPGNNRIVIFDSHRTYRYEFEGGKYFSTPVNVVVDSEGYIYVLGSTREGRKLFKFDFDGLFLSTIPLPREFDGQKSEYICLAIDENNILYVYDQENVQICIIDNKSGTIVKRMPILLDLDNKLRFEQVISSLTVRNGKIYIPVSSLGEVYVYTLDGEKKASIGYQGNNVGELNFPVEVKITNDNLVLVLDKHRINVVCFNENGKFLGEFGGKGNSPGWFYHPTILETNDHNQVYIGQIFDNKIQLCNIPQFIIDKNELLGKQSSIDGGAIR